MTSKKRVAKKNPKDDTETRSFAILDLARLNDLVRFERIGGKKEAIDGYLSFYEEDDSILRLPDQEGVLKNIPPVHYQVKGTEIPSTYYPCSLVFLGYCFDSIEPVFLFYVHTKRGSEKIYFKLIDKDFIRNTLNIENIQTYINDSKSVSFDESDVFTGDHKQLLDIFISKSPTFKEKSKKDVKPATADELQKHKEAIANILGDGNDKVLELEAFIFLGAPFDIFNLDTLRIKLGLTDKEMGFYIEKLLEKGVLTEKSEILSVSDVKVGKSLLDELITRKGIEYVYG